MRILLVSDSHGEKEILDQLIIRWPDVDLYLHAGDSLQEARSIYPFRTVRGNCDFYYDLQNELIIPTPFGKILMRHNKCGHEYMVKPTTFIQFSVQKMN